MVINGNNYILRACDAYLWLKGVGTKGLTSRNISFPRCTRVATSISTLWGGGKNLAKAT